MVDKSRVSQHLDFSRPWIRLCAEGQKRWDNEAGASLTKGSRSDRPQKPSPEKPWLRLAFAGFPWLFRTFAVGFYWLFRAPVVGFPWLFQRQTLAFPGFSTPLGGRVPAQDRWRPTDAASALHDVNKCKQPSAARSRNHHPSHGASPPHARSPAPLRGPMRFHFARASAGQSNRALFHVLFSKSSSALCGPNDPKHTRTSS